jgi:hypothetical protein
VSDWLERRAGQRSAGENKRASRVAAADPEAQQARATKRHALVLDGLDRLDRWLEDVLRQGLARLEAAGYAAFDEQARRLADAQAPGLAARVRACGERVGAGRDWPERVLEDLGLLALASHAYRRIEAIAAAHGGRAEDLRTFVGYTRTREEVLADGEALADRWLVLGQRTEDADAMRVQRTWLLGEDSGREALVVQFAAGARPFAEAFVPGTAFAGEVVFYPGAYPQRALVRRRDEASVVTGLPHSRAVADSLQRAAAAWGENPWLDRVLFVLRGVVPGDVDGPRVGGMVDSAGHGLAVDGRASGVLLAASGGAPVDLVGEWDGRLLVPLSLWGTHGFLALNETGTPWTR